MAEGNTVFSVEPQTNLFGVPVLPQQASNISPSRVTDTWVGFREPTFLGQLLCLLRAITTKICVAVNLAASGQFMTVQYHCDSHLVHSSFQKGINLVSFFLGKLSVAHCAPLPLVGEKKVVNDTSTYLLTDFSRVTLTYSILVFIYYIAFLNLD